MTYAYSSHSVDDVGAGKLREMLTLHTVNQHGVHGRFTLKDDCERQFWNAAGTVLWTQREN